MTKKIFSVIFFCGIFYCTTAQQTREELEQQRTQLKKDIEETEKQLNANKAKTKENLLQWKLINNKVELQDKVIDNINKDVRLLDNNIYTIQKDINRYNRLLDTMKAEYAKSMVYTYKNRGNYEFLNFIFSANSFNDAIRRIAYLKSYRNYQAIQGQNILRTQELRKNRIADLTGSKKEKNTVMKEQNKALAALETQKKEQDRVLNVLKKEGKTMNNQIAAKKKQMQKVSNAIAAAIKKAQQEAIAKAAAEERRRKEAEKKEIAKNNTSDIVKNTNTNTNTNTKSVTTAPKTAPAKKAESILLNADNMALNTNFEKNRGSLPWPVDKGYVLMHFGHNKLPSGADMTLTNVTIACEIGSSVKAVFDGTVSYITDTENGAIIVIQHGKYFTAYNFLTSVSVTVGQTIKTGQVLGKAAANIDGVGAVDFSLSSDKSELNPEHWLRRK
ncbi:MAG TPA: peptidoglycan DD-metalloendopeptidase family protein [Ferruginibacter sp.]|nr:peptidoglycan DD-metalloendopeptidase family protein [Ferruginibacter sp.]HRE64046.1 peptidoglycan DD-metalloendopeptidase family protein [Ferruginibacter sp.]